MSEMQSEGCHGVLGPGPCPVGATGEYIPGPPSGPTGEVGCGCGGAAGPVGPCGAMGWPGSVKNPIVACLMVKNEAATIERCVDSLRGKVTVIAVVDTGSTDDTMAVVRRLMETNPIAATQRPWTGFAESRSHAMGFARSIYEDGYILVIDADQTLEGEFPKDLTADAYMVELRSGVLRWRNLLLTRASLPFTCRGVAHEYVDCDRPHTKANLAGVTLVEHADGGGRPAGTQPRWERDLPALEAAIAENPDDTRSLFYLAQNLKDLAQTLPADPRAAEWRRRSVETYLRRADHPGGYQDERYYALFQAGRQLLLAGDADRGHAVLVRAVQFGGPARWEAAHELCRSLNRAGMYQVSYGVSRWVIQHRPAADGLFVHGDVVDYLMAFEHAIAAYWVGQYHESFECNDRILKRPEPMPSNIVAAAIRNQAFASDRILKG